MEGQVPIVLVPPVLTLAIAVALWGLTGISKERIVTYAVQAYVTMQLIALYAGLSYIDSQQETPYSGVFLILMIALALLLGGVRRMK
jgi:hypothetical protein